MPPEPKLKIVPPEPSALWANGMAPEVMTTFLVWTLRAHFGDPACVVDPVFRDVPWTPDPNEPWASGPTGIAIESQDRWHPALVERRPAIIVKDHALRPVRQGLADRMEGTRAADGFDRYATMLESSNTALCVAGAPLACKRLATEVSRLLVQFSDAIRRQVGLVRFAVAERGETGELRESQTHFATPVSVAWQTLETWVVREQTPTLAKILLDVTTDLHRR